MIVKSLVPGKSRQFVEEHGTACGRTLHRDEFVVALVAKCVTEHRVRSSCKFGTRTRRVVTEMRVLSQQ